MKNKSMLDYTLIPILAALAIVIGLLEIPWPIGPIGLRLDFSEVITLVSIFLIGFRKTSLMLLLKALARFLILRLAVWQTGAYEEFMALFASFMYVFAFMIAFKIKPFKNKYANYSLQGVFISVFVTVIMFFFNFLFSTPFYLSLMIRYIIEIPDMQIHLSFISFVKDPLPSQILGADINGLGVFFVYCLAAYIPFNLLKGAISSVVFYFIGDRLKSVYSGIPMKYKEEDSEVIDVLVSDDSHNKDDISNIEQM